MSYLFSLTGNQKTYNKCAKKLPPQIDIDVDNVMLLTMTPMSIMLYDQPTFPHS